MNSSELFSLSGRKILVTGAAGHLGRALCEYLLSDGATVVAVDIDVDGLDALSSELDPTGDAMVVFAADLSDEQQRARLAGRVLDITDSLDGVVFAAAFVGTSDLEGWDVDFGHQSVTTWRKALELNLTAPFHLTQLLEPLLLRAGAASIVNIGSIYGSLAPDWSLYEGLGMSNPAAYGVSKGGLVQLTRWLASVLAPKIRVNIVSPGGIKRNQDATFISRYVSNTPLGSMATEQDVVGAIVFLLGSSSSHLTAQEICVDGGRSSI